MVDLDLEKGHVFVRQDWEYRWRVQFVMRLWNEAEKLRFHRQVDRHIWRVWSMRARFLIHASPRYLPGRDGIALLRRYGSRGLTLSFDVRRRQSGGHWKVTVLKMQDQSDNRASVDVFHREITLYAEDVNPSDAVNDAGATRTDFLTFPHEFGHTLNANDEYDASSPHLVDSRSLMNIGLEVRARHLQLLCDTLGKMVPGCIFRAQV